MTEEIILNLKDELLNTLKEKNYEIISIYDFLEIAAPREVNRIDRNNPPPDLVSLEKILLGIKKIDERMLEIPDAWKVNP